MKGKELQFRYGEPRFDVVRGLQIGIPILLGGIGLFVYLGAGRDRESILWFSMVSAVMFGFVFSRVPSHIIIGRRFVIVGLDVAYFQTLTQVKIDREKKTLALLKGRYPVCVIKAEGFPTNARKPEKITRNRATKFAKVAEKLLASIKKTAPELEIVQV